MPGEFVGNLFGKKSNFLDSDILEVQVDADGHNLIQMVDPDAVEVLAAAVTEAVVARVSVPFGSEE